MKRIYVQEQRGSSARLGKGKNAVLVLGKKLACHDYAPPPLVAAATAGPGAVENMLNADIVMMS